MAHDDARDAQLLADGDIAALLATYDHVIRARCIARLRGALDAEDVAQNVRLRLLAEFRRGKSYAVPYRVVVHNVIDWTLGDHFAGRPTDVPLPDDWEPPEDGHADAVVTRYFVADLLGGLPPREREVGEARYMRGLEHEQIAAELGISRNNVDQALHRLHRHLREVILV